jgi:hypothetical protein
VGLSPHYTQVKGFPVVAGSGFGLFGCPCGQSLLIAGYEPRNFLGIAIQCAACGLISETPGLPPGAVPPPNVTMIERAADNPPATVAGDVVLISREEMERLAALYLPRPTDASPHVISEALLDEVEEQQRRWTNEPLGASPGGYKDQALAWAVAHFRSKLRTPDWQGFSEDGDLVAMTVISAFRDLIAGWSHHPLFDAMIGTAAVQGFSLHAMAMFAAAKALTSAGNRVGFAATRGPRPRIASLRLVLSSQDQMSVAVNRFDRFEWPDGAVATPQTVRAAVIEAMGSVQGSINRLRPGMLVLSPGAVAGTLEQLFVDAIVAAVGSHGKRHRGLAAVSAIFPKIALTGTQREARFGYSFYPIANRNHSIGQSVRIGSRGDFSQVP